MVAYIDEHKGHFGVEPICNVLPIAPSRYYEWKAREREPERRPERMKRDEALKPEVQRVWEENFAWIASTASSRRHGRTPCGSRI